MKCGHGYRCINACHGYVNACTHTHHLCAYIDMYVLSVIQLGNLYVAEDPQKGTTRISSLKEYM